MEEATKAHSSLIGEPRVKSVLSDSKYRTLPIVLCCILIGSRLGHRVVELEGTLGIFPLPFHPINEHGSRSWAFWMQILTPLFINHVTLGSYLSILAFLYPYTWDNNKIPKSLGGDYEV